LGRPGRQHKWYEVIVVDPNHPSIRLIKTLNGCAVINRKAAYSEERQAQAERAGARDERAIGTEKTRPSLRSHHNTGK